jgi:hypothetical protein
MTEFKINKYLTLKLEYGKTKIYVGGKLFRQCKFLLLDLPIDEITELDNIQSIDEASQKLAYDLERNSREYEIPPEVEFWGHCSNLQVWAENQYNSQLLHRNLAFPLLKSLEKKVT